MKLAEFQVLLEEVEHLRQQILTVDSICLPRNPFNARLETWLPAEEKATKPQT